MIQMARIAQAATTNQSYAIVTNQMASTTAKIKNQKSKRYRYQKNAG